MEIGEQYHYCVTVLVTRCNAIVPSNMVTLEFQILALLSTVPIIIYRSQAVETLLKSGVKATFQFPSLAPDVQNATSVSLAYGEDESRDALRSVQSCYC